MHANVTRVITAAADAGLRIEVTRYPEGTRTAADAARAIGCTVGQIVKSLAFIVDASPVIALVSGTNRVDMTKLARAAGGSAARRADGDEAREATGYAIGGVPPFGHVHAVRVFVDRDLLPLQELWAAAGLPDAVFAIRPDDLVRVSGGTVVELAATEPS